MLMYAMTMYFMPMYAMYATPIERIVGDTAKLLDEKGALAGNITRTELRAAMEDCVRQAVEMYERRIGRLIPVEDFETGRYSEATVLQMAQQHLSSVV